MARTFKKYATKAKTVKKPSKKRDPSEVYQEYLATLEPLVFLDRSRTTRLLEILGDIVPERVLSKNPELKKLLEQTSIAVKSQNEVRQRLIKLNQSDKTEEKVVKPKKAK